MSENAGQPRRVVFLGPPGAGKGTHATWLAQQGAMLHLSTGDMLRAAVREGTELGSQAKQFMDAGKLVPDALIIDMLFETLSARGGEAASGWILDGFPRTEPQAVALDERLDAKGEQLDAVLLFDVDSDELVERLSSRLTCKGCSAIYNRRLRPPEVEGVCDRCGGNVVQRADDEPAAVRKRLEVYADQTAPLIDYYDQRGKLLRIDAARSIEEVRGAVLRHLGIGHTETEH
ncbi:MAG: adenylate kinase [Planctomycetes bacterium]|nr:adenylate kinase [Planctomycetota bacterium]